LFWTISAKKDLRRIPIVLQTARDTNALGRIELRGLKKTWEKKGHSLAEELGTGEQNELPGLGEEED
jgi:hypothetical protein